MTIHLLDVPYSLGREAVGSGRGPIRLLDAGLVSLLGEHGHDVRSVHVRRAGEFQHEVGASFDVTRVLAAHVRRTLDGGGTPLVLAGDCSACLGILAGMTPGRIGVVWFDSHGDFNTPETTVSGFLGGMPLAAAVGRCWTALCAGIPGFEPVRESRVVLYDARSLDPKEEAMLRGSAVQIVDGGAALARALDELAIDVDAVYLHVDLDVLDPRQVRANIYAEPGGLSVEQVIEGIDSVAHRVPIRAATLSAYDPGYDEDGRATAAGLRIVAALARAITPAGISRSRAPGPP
jgi:arginase